MITSVNAFSLRKKPPPDLPRGGGEWFVLPQDSIKFLTSPAVWLAWSLQSYEKVFNLQTFLREFALIPMKML